MSSPDFLYRKKIQEEKCKIEISHQKESKLKDLASSQDSCVV